MERGLLWLPLLAVFIGLAWAGWNEYQKVEAYRLWAESFERAKYDIYAVLGLKGRELTWGVPTRKGPSSLEIFSLDDVKTIRVLVNGQPVDPTAPPSKGRATLEFACNNHEQPICIPFTESPLAVQWWQFLEKEL